MTLFSIGHSNLDAAPFIARLQEHGVTALADVRSHPYSRFLPHFNRAALHKCLVDAGIQYVFLGQELGARPEDPDCYQDGKAIYERIAATERFKLGLQRLRRGLERYNVAIMCAEQDPLTCHRAILVCQQLRRESFPIHHILKTGELESHFDLETRMLDRYQFRYAEQGLPSHAQLSLLVPAQPLRSREDCLQEAYRIHGQQVAYVEPEVARVHFTLADAPI